ncbi:MAG TPA: non-ribosomal peptide synthetase, partial [Thermoanaerobaculia bacterium]|nr:non-ribosomal peptide synthetase [Thermoanaerobaculia bacterium]
GDEQRLDPAALVDELRRREVDALDVTPSQLRLLLDAGLASGDGAPRLLLVGGEAIDGELWRRLAALDGVEVHNLYGPTETTVDATTAVVDGGRPHVGRPLDDVRAYVLDAALEPLPPGVAGELFLAGAGVARGYLGRPAETAAVFVPDPFGGDGGEGGGRLYRTGDRVRLRPDGAVEFVDRVDRQVKVRGHRVELGEVEVALSRHPRVDEVAVKAWGDGAGGVRLVGYLVAADGADGLAEEVVAYAAERLPEAMVPALLVARGELPRLPNGKVDRGALEEPDRGAADGAGYVAPRSASEERLAAVWADVLKLERVGVEDDFFAIGGHSLLAMQLVLRIRQEFDVDLPLLELIERPNVAGLAARIGELQVEQASEEDDEALSGLLSEVEGLSDEELAAMLAEED